MKTRSGPTQEAAEMLAIQALAFLAEEPERLGGFLAATGVSAAQIRRAAREPGFLAGVLDHMLGDENLLTDFARGASIDPADVPGARRVLHQRSGLEPP